MIHFLEMAVSLIFFTNKTMILVGKKVGWLIGAIAAVLAAVYFYQIGLNVFMVLEIGLVILMTYGFLKKKEAKRGAENRIRGVIVIVMFLMFLFCFNGSMTLAEFISGLGMLFGTYFLTRRRMVVGWALYVCAHALCAWIGYEKGQDFFYHFQIASAIVSLTGLIKELKDY